MLAISDEEEYEASSASTRAPKPRQDSLQKEISSIQIELESKVRKRDAGLGEEGIDSSIKKLRKDLDKKRKELTDKQNRAKLMRKVRARQKEEVLKLRKANADIPVTIRGQPGRPSLQQDQVGLMEAIADIAMHGSSAAEKRRSDELRACKTLRQMADLLRERGYELSNSALYLRLLPRRSDTSEGRRHVTTVPVKLCRAQADLHRDHADQQFCRATINGLEEVASILGPDQVCLKQRNKTH